MLYTKQKTSCSKVSRIASHPTSKTRKSVHDVAFRIGKGVLAEKEGAAAGTRHTNNFSKRSCSFSTNIPPPIRQCNAAYQGTSCILLDLLCSVARLCDCGRVEGAICRSHKNWSRSSSATADEQLRERCQRDQTLFHLLYKDVLHVSGITLDVRS